MFTLFVHQAMATKKNLKYCMSLNWSYTIEQETHKGNQYYIIRVNELPGVCIDAATIEEGMQEIRDVLEAALRLYLKNKEPIPEPIVAAKNRLSQRASSTVST